MQFRLFSLALIVLNCVDHSHCQPHHWKRSKRASNAASPICRGCAFCSNDNGCLTCQPRLFLFLRREGMRQYGECLHACPPGFYGLRGPDFSICSRCRLENCEFCFSKDFCTKCRAGQYLHRGRCFEECPAGLAPLEDSMECGDGCEVGPWSDWGTCTRRNRTCGFKWGLETRTRPIVKKPPRDSIPCPTIAESRRCRMPKRHCRKGSGKQRSKHQDSSSTRRDSKRKSQKSLRAQAQDQHSAHLSTARPRPRHRRFASWDKAAAPQCQAPLSQ
ncbi:R-spondin-2-like [Paramormyrops kingsleyae]|uniref:R-spondin-2 n=1 Tax=Paramormyrops kingsleyae TaxID=1676925 RepID=A0A3B3T1J3_9TELE|nr:R-spondin-2-like [Paramormyrops kingsleyae]